MLRFSALLLPAALLLISPAAAPAQTPPATAVPTGIPVSASEQPFSLNVANVSLHDVATLLERQRGIKCLVQDGKIPYRPLNVSLTNVPLSAVLLIIATSAGAQVAQNAKGVYVFTPAETTLQPAPFPMPPRLQDPYDPHNLPWKITLIQRTSASLDLIDRE